MAGKLVLLSFSVSVTRAGRCVGVLRAESFAGLFSLADFALARVVGLDPDRGIADEGLLPLAHFLDSGGPDALAATIEADPEGAVYPVVYLRRSGRVEERALPGHPLNDFGTEEHRRALAGLLDEIGVAAAQ